MSGVYRCFHCQDLHFSADQGRHCAACEEARIGGAVEEARRRAKRGPVPWRRKVAFRSGQRWTPSERRMWSCLHAALPGEAILAQWCIPGCDYRVDFLLPVLGLVLEVDGRSHHGREGADMLRSMDLRALGYEVTRAAAEHVRRDGGFIASQIAFRVHAYLASEPSPAEEPAEAAFS